MNTLDVVIGVLCLGSAILGVVMGPLRQISKLAGLVLGLLLAKKYGGWAQETMRLRFAHGDVVAYLILLVAVYVAVRLVGWAVEHSLRGEKLSGSERLTGALAGLVHGAALSVVVVFLLVAVSPRDASLFRESKAAPTAIRAAGWAQAVFPKEVREPFREKASAASGAGGVESHPAPSSSAPPKAAAPPKASASTEPNASTAPQPKKRSKK